MLLSVMPKFPVGGVLYQEKIFEKICSYGNFDLLLKIEISGILNWFYLRFVL